MYSRALLRAQLIDQRRNLGSLLFHLLRQFLDGFFSSFRASFHLLYLLFEQRGFVRSF